MKTGDIRKPARRNRLTVVLVLLFAWCVPHTALSIPQAGASPPIWLARTDAGKANQPSGNRMQEDRQPSLAVNIHQKKREGVWIAASPVLLGFNTQALETAAQNIGRMKGVYGLLLVRDGFLVVEQYFREGYRTKPHNIKSASKSVISALIGIAVDEGLLHLDQPICDIIPGTREMNDPRKADITVKHLLTMTSGLKPTSYQAYNAWVLNGNWVNSAIDQPLVADPGTHFQYSTGNTHLLSAVLTAVSGMSTKAYAERKLFDPMEITIHGWDTDPKGIYQGGNNLQLIPRDLARIGQLYLDDGRYQGRQLVPEKWIEASTRPGLFGKNDVYGSYGYLWFSRPGGYDAFVAVGFGGQYLYVSKEHRCIVVITATLESKGREWEKRLFHLIQDGIFSAIQYETMPALRIAGRKGADEPPSSPDRSPRLYPISQTTRNVILRQKPDRQSRRLGLVPSGSRIDILETRKQWHRTTYGGITGWLFSPYVNIFISEEPEPFSAATPLIAYEGDLAKPSSDVSPESRTKAPRGQQLSGDGRARVRLNLRTGPSQADSVIRILVAGTPFEIKEQIGPWYRVRAGSYSGWVYGEYVQVLSDLPVTIAKRQRAEPEAETETTQASNTATDAIKALETLGDRISRLADRMASSEQTQSYFEKALNRFESLLAEEQERSTSYNQDRELLLQELSDLSKSLKRQQNATRSVDSAGKALLADVDGLHTRVDALKETLSRVRSLRDSQKTELAALERSLTEQRTQSDRSETERRRLMESLTGTTSQVVLLQTALAETNAAQDILVSDISAMKQAISKQQQADAAIGKDRAALVASLAKLRAQLAPLDQTAETARADRNRLSHDISALKNELSEIRAAGKSAVGDRNALASALDALNTKMAGFQTALEEARFDRELLKTGIAEADSLSVERSAAAVSEVKHALSGQSAKLASVQADIEIQKEALNQIGAELQSFAEQSAKADLVRADVENQKRALDRISADLQSFADQPAKLASLQTELERQRKDLDQVGAEMQTLDGRLAAVGESNRKVKEELVALQQADKRLKHQDLEIVKSRDAALASAVGQINGLKNALDATSVAGKETALELSGLKQAFAESEKAILQKAEDLKTRDSRAADARDALAASIEKTRIALADIKGSQETTHQQVRATEKSIISEQVWLRNRLSDLEAELEREQRDRQAGEEQWRKEKAELESAISSAEAQLGSLRAELKRKDVSDGKEAAELKAAQQDMVRQLESALTEAKKHRDALQLELTETQKGLGKQQQLTRAVEGAGKGLLTEIDGIRTQTAALNETLSRVRSIRDNQKEEIHRLGKELEAVKGTDHQQDANRRELITEINAIRQQMDSHRQTLEDSTALSNSRGIRLAEAAKQISALQKALAASQSGQKALSSGLDEVKDRIGRQEEAQLRSGTARKALETELMSAERQVAQLKEELETLQRRRAVPSETPALPATDPTAAKPPQRIAGDSRKPLLEGKDPLKTPSAQAETSHMDDELRQFALFWADAWQSKRVDVYLSCYSKRFQPAKGLDLPTWQRQRWIRIQKPASIKLTIENIRTKMVEASKAVIVFDQRYQSNTYSDQVVKALEVAKEEEGWKIVRETSR